MIIIEMTSSEGWCHFRLKDKIGGSFVRRQKGAQKKVLQLQHPE